MATDPTTIPSIADLQKTKKYMDDIDDFVSSENESFTDTDGVNRKTMEGIENEADNIISEKTTEFDNIISEKTTEFDNLIDEVKESRGYNNAGTFAAGFTYEKENDVGYDDDGNAWELINKNDLPYLVTAGTTPTNPPFNAVIFGSAAQVSTNTSDTAQSFMDSFALKIFQSPTDGLTEINTRTLLGGEVYEVRKVSDDSLATIYSDAAGTTEIVQNGTSNVSGNDGVIEFFVADGDYYIEVGSVKGGLLVSRLKPFLTVEDMTGASYLSKYVEDTLITWLDYREKNDGGGNTGLLKFGAHTEDGGSIFSIDANTYVEANLKGQKVNVRKFGAVGGDGTVAIQRAINYIEEKYTTEFRGAILYFPEGLYDVTSTLTLSKPGSSLSWLGDGLRNSVLRAVGTEPFDVLVTLGVDASFYGAFTMQGLTFDGNEKVDVLVDAKESRYITITDCEFKDFLTTGLIISKWTVKVINNYFYGYSELAATGETDTVCIYSGLVTGSTSALNDVTIEKNTFHKCGVGVELGAGANDVDIINNSFDVCVRVAVYGYAGGGKIAIKQNYFERCGKTLAATDTTNPVTYPTTGNPIHGVVILHELQGAESFGWKHLRIDDSNTFRNCSSKSTIALSNVFDMVVEGNDYDDAYPTDTFVHLFGECQGFVTRTVKGKISGEDANISKFVTIDANSANPFEEGYCSNLVIQPISKGSALSHNKLLVANDFMKFKSPSQVATETSFGTSTKFTVDSPIAYDNIISINFSDVDIRGRYIRVMAGARSTSETSNGVILTTIHDGINNSTGDKYESLSAEAVYSAGFKYLRGGLFYVPKELSTSWGLRVLNRQNAQMEMVQFAVFDAAVDPDVNHVFKNPF